MTQHSKYVRLTDEMLEPCLDCAPYRETEPARAMECRRCRGTGRRRKASSYVCNKCGEGLCPAFESHGFTDAYGLVEAEVDGGYFSDDLSDMTVYVFSLCERCLRGIFDACKVPPLVVDLGDGSREDYAEHAAALVRRAWQREHAAARFGTGRCNYEEACEGKAEHVCFLSQDMTTSAYCAEHAAVPYAMNTRFLPAHAFAGQLVSREAREAWSPVQHEAHAGAWLALTAPERATWWRFAPGPLRDLTIARVRRDHGFAHAPLGRRFLPAFTGAAPGSLFPASMRIVRRNSPRSVLACVHSLEAHDGAFSLLWVPDAAVVEPTDTRWEALADLALMEEAGVVVELERGVALLFPQDEALREDFRSEPPAGSRMHEIHHSVERILGGRPWYPDIFET